MPRPDDPDQNQHRTSEEPSILDFVQAYAWVLLIGMGVAVVVLGVVIGLVSNALDKWRAKPSATGEQAEAPGWHALGVVVFLLLGGVMCALAGLDAFQLIIAANA